MDGSAPQSLAKAWCHQFLPVPARSRFKHPG